MVDREGVEKDLSFGAPREDSGDVLTSIFENLPNMVFLKDAQELRFVTLNRAGEELLGLTRDEIVGKSDHDFFPKEQADAFTAQDRAVLASGEAVDIPEEPISTPHSGVRILHTKKVPVLGPDGAPRFLLGISEDITDLKQVERALRDRESELRGLFEAIPDLIFRIDRSGRFLSFIPARGIRLLAPESGFIGRHLEDVLPPPIASRTRIALEKAFELDTPQIVEYELQEADGLRYFEARLVRSRDDESIALVRDVTDWRRAEESARLQLEQLAHATRTATMGEMATGLAHEVNQPLAAILNHAEACLLAARRGTISTDQIIDDLGAIVAQAERATGIIRHLRDFVRKSQRVSLPMNLNRIVESTVSFVAFEARAANVTIETSLSGLLPNVSGDPVELQQVVMNLLRNSIEAMASLPSGGTVHVTTTSENGAVQIRVRDEGPKLEDTEVQEFFQTYFSTKPRGLGLGLTISRSIVERHGGQLTASASPDRGAEFLIQIPSSGAEGSDV